MIVPKKLLAVSAILSLFLGGSTLVSAWTAPAQQAPNGNVNAPIHTGTGIQIKGGSNGPGTIGANTFIGNTGIFSAIAGQGLPALIANSSVTLKGITVSKDGDLTINDGKPYVAGSVLTDMNGNGIATWQPMSGGGPVPTPTLSTTTTNVVSALDIKYVGVVDQDGGDPRYNKAYCPGGYKVIGGGGRCGHNNRQIKESSPIIGNPRGSGADNSWTKIGRTNTDTGIDTNTESNADGWLIDCGGTGDDFNIEVYAICAKEITTTVTSGVTLNPTGGGGSGGGTGSASLDLKGPITANFICDSNRVESIFDFASLTGGVPPYKYTWTTVPSPASSGSTRTYTTFLQPNTSYTVFIRVEDSTTPVPVSRRIQQTFTTPSC